MIHSSSLSKAIMTSLKGLITILGITAFAGIGGLYVLEELCDRQQRKPRTVQLPRYDDPSKESTEQPRSNDEVEPYTLNMQNVKDEDEVTEETPKESTQSGGDGEDEKGNQEGLPAKRDVIFEFHDVSDEDSDDEVDSP